MSSYPWEQSGSSIKSTNNPLPSISTFFSPIDNLLNQPFPFSTSGVQSPLYTSNITSPQYGSSIGSQKYEWEVGSTGSLVNLTSPGSISSLRSPYFPPAESSPYFNASKTFTRSYSNLFPLVDDISLDIDKEEAKKRKKDADDLFDLLNENDTMFIDSYLRNTFSSFQSLSSKESSRSSESRSRLSPLRLNEITTSLKSSEFTPVEELDTLKLHLYPHRTVRDSDLNVTNIKSSQKFSSNPIYRTVSPRRKKRSKNDTVTNPEQINVVRALISYETLKMYCLSQQLMILNQCSPFKLYLNQKYFTIFMGASVIGGSSIGNQDIIYHFLWGDKKTDIYNSLAVAEVMKKTLYIYGLTKHQSQYTLDPYDVEKSLKHADENKIFNTNGYEVLKYEVDSYKPSSIYSEKNIIFDVAFNLKNKKDMLKKFTKFSNFLTPQARNYLALPGAKPSISFDNEEGKKMVLVYEPSNFFLPKRMLEDPYEEMRKQFESFEKERIKKLKEMDIDPATIRNFSNRIVLSAI